MVQRVEPKWRHHEVRAMRRLTITLLIAVTAAAEVTASKAARVPSGAVRNVSYAAAVDLRDLLTLGMPETGQYSFTRAGSTLTLMPGQYTAMLNGEVIPLNAPAYIDGGRLFVPARVLSHVGCALEVNYPGNIKVTCPGKMKYLDVSIW